MLTFTVVATKGGVGKTTLTANCGGLLADYGYRVLLIDADIQNSLSRYYDLSHVAPAGLTKMIISGTLTDECISHAMLPPSGLEASEKLKYSPKGYIHIVCSDAKSEHSQLQVWMSNQLDRLVRIRIALNNPWVHENYDICIIDTQGAVGYLQDAAVNAADVLIAPVAPDILSAREFVDGTLAIMARHEASANLGFKVPPIQCVINKTQNTVDSRVMQQLIRDQFLEMRGRVNVLETVLPDAVAFKRAATSQLPVHWVDPIKASDAMHSFMWELVPSLVGHFVPSHRGELAQTYAAIHASNRHIEGESSDSSPDVAAPSP